MGGIALPLFGSVAGRQSQPEPNELPSLNLWFNGSSSATTVNTTTTDNFNVPVTNGTSISAWKDLTKFGHDANVTGGVGPQPAYATNICNGLGMLEFTSANSDNLDINPIAWSQNLPGITIYVLARPTSYASQFPLAATEIGTGVLYDGTNMRVGAAGATATTSSFSKDTNKCHMFGMIFDGSQIGNENRLKFRINGEQQSLSFTGTVGTLTSSSASYFFVGGENRSGITLGFMDGYVGEVMIWTRTLTFSEQLGVESYLRNKWGLTST